MLITHHLLFNFVLALVFFPFYSWKVLFIFISGVLIDIDHYLLFVLKYKSFNVRDAYAKFKEAYEIGKRQEPIEVELIFHSIEFFILILVLSFFSDIFLIMFIGLFFHLLTDKVIRKWVRQIKKNRKITSYSLIGWYKNKEKLKF